MYKILIDKTLYGNMDKSGTILQRADVKVFTAGNNDEILSLHKQEKVSVIIARLDAPGTPPSRVYAQIRADAELKGVSLILVCKDVPAERARAEQCGANAVETVPLNYGNLLEKAKAFLKIPARGSYRVLLSVSIDTNKDASFFCRSENISVTGLLLETDRTFAPGDRLNCSFFLPGAKQIEATGEIVRAIERRDKPAAKYYGVRFTKISSLDAAAINDFIKKKSEKH